jgi:excisionase family DNA binding protein
MPEKLPKLTTREFAERTGLSVSTVSKYIRDGKIKGNKESGRWMIPEDQIGRVRESDSGPSAPPSAEKSNKPAASAEPKAEKPSPGGKSYTVEEFSHLTFLTPKGVVKYLKEGILDGTKGEGDQWRVAGDSLENPQIAHLIR